MTKKEQIKEIMLKNFGPASANLIDRMTEEEAIVKSRTKLMGFFGPEKAKLIDKLM
jgi:hypothetical protein